MRRIVIAFAICLICAVSGMSQGMDLFLGYSFLRANSARDIPAFTNNGGLGTIAFDFNRHIGVEAEFGGYHNGNIHDIQFDTTEFTYLFGPRISYGRRKRVDPYVHILFGGIHASSSVKDPTNPLVRLSTSQDAFAMAVGGGLDIRVSRAIAFRPIQLDYVLTRIQDLGLQGPSENRNQNNLRYAAGFKFMFGGAR
jgi:opacity protein-like surface antigen